MLVKRTDFIRVSGKKDIGESEEMDPRAQPRASECACTLVGPAESASTCTAQRPSEDKHMLGCMVTA